MIALAIILLIINRVYSEITCNSAISCAEAHLNSSQFEALLARRCDYDKIPSLKKANLYFLHIPKSGGSMVNSLMTKAKITRYKHKNSNPHVPLYVATNGTEKGFYYTMFRDPVDKAISIYNYINGYRVLPASTRKEEIWRKTHKNPPTNWVKDPFVRDWLYGEVLSMFLTNYTSLNGKVVTKLENYMNVTLPLYLPYVGNETELYHYALNFPQKYQCLDFLRVVEILMRRFAVVGVLTQVKVFWQTFARRAGLAMKLADDFSRHPPVNKSRNRLKSIEIDYIRTVFEEVLYCEKVLYALVNKISARDAYCLNASASIGGGKV